MPTDIIPQSYQNLHDWLENLLPKVPTQGPVLGMTPTEITDFTAVLTTLKTDVDAVLAAQAALDTATGILQQALTDNLPEIRRVIKNMKSSKGYNDGIGADLQIVATAGSFSAETYKPTITAEAFPGYVRIKGKKVGADAFNIYMRLKGQPTFKLIATNRSRFPFDDDSPLAQPGTAETREYQAMGVVADKEIGQPSDIVSVLYGG
jgi:hypothetical protein